MHTPILYTKQLQLQPLNIAHAADMFFAINTYRDQLRTWLPFVDCVNEIAEAEAYIEYTKDLDFAIYKNTDFVGIVGLNDYDAGSSDAEMGYWVSPPMQRHGYITEACRCVVNFAFNELKINKLKIEVAFENFPSIRVAEKLGFMRKGIEFDGELLQSGYTDLQVFSLLKSEYKC